MKLATPDAAFCCTVLPFWVVPVSAALQPLLLFRLRVTWLVSLPATCPRLSRSSTLTVDMLVDEGVLLGPGLKASCEPMISKVPVLSAIRLSVASAACKL